MTSPLPQDLETERALLDALLMDPHRVIKDCWSAGLQAADFARPAHGVIYDVIVSRIKAGEDIDLVSLINELRRTDVPAERGATVNGLAFVGGQPYLMTLSSAIGVVALAKSYAKEIVSQANSRELVLAGEELERLGRELAPVSDVVTATERRLARVRDRAEGRHDGVRPSDIGDILQRVLNHYISTDPDDTIPFDLPSLNAIGGGMFPGDVIVIGARSGVGKSWSGLAAIERAVEQGRRCALFSIEMPAEQMARRLLAMGGLNLTGLRKRALPYANLEDRANHIDTWSGLLDVFDGTTTVDRIQGALASARIDGKPYRLVVVDHVHLLEVPGRGDTYRLSLNAELTRIKHMAIEHGTTIILLAQLARPDKKKADPRPTKHDLRESGGLGDIADYVLMLHRDTDEQGAELTTGSLIVDKVRDGAGTGDIDVVFDTRTYRFRESTGGFMAGMPNGRVA